MTDDAAPSPDAAPAPPPRRLDRLRPALARAWRERGAPPLSRGGGWTGLTPPLLAGLTAAVLFAALCLGAAGERLARSWTAEFGAAATLMVAGPPEGRADRFQAAIRALETTPGVAAVRPMPAEERRALLAPWLGPEEAAPADPPPMAAVTLENGGPDAEMLALRLQAEAPGAVYDDHAAWRGPLLSAAWLARLSGWGAAAAAGVAAAAAAGLSAAAWTAAARPEQRLLRRLGAGPEDLRRAWAGRAARRAFAAALLGTGLAALALAAPPALWGEAARTPLAPRGLAWGWAALSPALAALAAWLGARRALRPVLHPPSRPEPAGEDA
jgi:cell division transport system permease protein